MGGLAGQNSFVRFPTGLLRYVRSSGAAEMQHQLQRVTALLRRTADDWAVGWFCCQYCYPISSTVANRNHSTDVMSCRKQFAGWAAPLCPVVPVVCTRQQRVMTQLYLHGFAADSWRLCLQALAWLQPVVESMHEAETDCHQCSITLGCSPDYNMGNQLSTHFALSCIICTSEIERHVHDVIVRHADLLPLPPR